MNAHLAALALQRLADAERLEPGQRRQGAAVQPLVPVQHDAELSQHPAEAAVGAACTRGTRMCSSDTHPS